MMERFIIQEPEDLLDEVQRFDISELGKINLLLEVAGVVVGTDEFIPVAFLSSDNIRACEVCGKAASFERVSDVLPHEGDVCCDCGTWVCYFCSKYGDGEKPRCPSCDEQHRQGNVK
jgi:hypothetical protein